jgi:hypothetical protein
VDLLTELQVQFEARTGMRWSEMPCGPEVAASAELAGSEHPTLSTR